MGWPISASWPVDQVSVQLTGGATWLGTAQPATRGEEAPAGAGTGDEAEAVDEAAPAARDSRTAAAHAARTHRPEPGRRPFGLAAAPGPGWFDPLVSIRQG